MEHSDVEVIAGFEVFDKTERIVPHEMGGGYQWFGTHALFVHLLHEVDYTESTLFSFHHILGQNFNQRVIIFFHIKESTVVIHSYHLNTWYSGEMKSEASELVRHFIGTMKSDENGNKTHTYQYAIVLDKETNRFRLKCREVTMPIPNETVTYVFGEKPAEPLLPL